MKRLECRLVILVRMYENPFCKPTILKVNLKIQFLEKTVSRGATHKWTNSKGVTAQGCSSTHGSASCPQTPSLDAGGHIHLSAHGRDTKGGR